LFFDSQRLDALKTQVLSLVAFPITAWYDVVRHSRHEGHGTMLILERSTVGGRLPPHTDYSAAFVNSVQHVRHLSTVFSAYECGVTM